MLRSRAWTVLAVALASCIVIRPQVAVASESPARLAPAYTGSKVNITRQNATVRFELTNVVEEEDGHFGGQLTVNTPFVGNGPVTGVVTGNNVVFTILDATSDCHCSSIVYNGTVAPSGALSGTYISYAVGGAEEQNGTWTLEPGISNPPIEPYDPSRPPPPPPPPPSPSNAVVTPQSTPGDARVLASSSTGGVWYAGELSPAPLTLGYVTPAGGLLNFAVSLMAISVQPAYMTPGANGAMWFLAYAGINRTAPILGKIDPSGAIVLHPVAADPESEVRGLALGPDGNLWMTETRVQGPTRLSAIVRVTPAGTATAFASGLQRGADPWSITSGPEGALWFTDTVGRIGTITTAGSIREFQIGRRIVTPGGRFEEVFPRPIVAAGGDLWFIVDAAHIGRMSAAGHVTLYTPASSYQLPSDYYAPEKEGELRGMTVGPEGEVWFTRRSGELARIDRHGRVRTVTDRLVEPFGLAFAGDGAAWVGEGGEYGRNADGSLDGNVVIGRLARVTASGAVKQYSELPQCHVPLVVGYGPSYASAQIRSANCEVGVGQRLRRSRLNQLIVISQSRRPGTIAPYKAAVRLVLGSRPTAPKNCRAPRYTHAIARSRELVAWFDPLSEPAEGESHGEGIQQYFACVPPNGPKHVFFTEESDLTYYNAIHAIRAAGHFLAFASSSADHYNDGARELTLYDAKSGRAVFSKAFSFEEGDTIYRRFAALAANASGDLGWVEEAGSLAAHTDTLRVRDRSGTHTVERATDITDLALRGDLLTWDSEGQARSRTVR